jgi:hypothetical protein
MNRTRMLQLAEGKKPTFAEVRKLVLDRLVKEGWAVKADLKVPHATSPDGKTRLWFKTQAVYGNDTGTDPRDFANTHSWTSDLRDFADTDKFMDLIARWTKD